MIGIADRLPPYLASVHELATFALGRSGMSEIPMRLMRAHCLLKPFPSCYPEPSPEPRPGIDRPCLGRGLGYSGASSPTGCGIAAAFPWP
jgi:hypothetical protein